MVGNGGWVDRRGLSSEQKPGDIVGGTHTALRAGGQRGVGGRRRGEGKWFRSEGGAPGKTQRWECAGLYP